MSRKLLGKGPIGPKEILGFSKWNFSQQIPASVPAGFAVNFLLGFSAVSGLKRKKTLGD